MSTLVKHYLLKAGIPVDLYDILTEYCADLDLTADDRREIVDRILLNSGSITIVINIGDFTSGYAYQDDYIAIQSSLAFTKKCEWRGIDAIAYVRNMAKALMYLKNTIWCQRGLSRSGLLYDSAVFSMVASMIPYDPVVNGILSGKFILDRSYMKQ